jgi:flavin reductase (DIM6/NTAB) family NADH-FMN oxidoreductase RutF
MMFDLSELSRQQGAKLLLSTIVPRPIAWVVTVDADGRANAAPFSFFNALCSYPPIVGLGLGARESADKDTARNIRQMRQLVINLVPANLAEAMNICATDFEAGTNELDLLDLRTAPSQVVRPPRIAESPVALECEVTELLEMSSGALIVLAEVKMVHVADEFVLDAEKCYIDAPKMMLLGRMHGTSYGQVSELFEMPRLDADTAIARAKRRPRSRR